MLLLVIFCNTAKRQKADYACILALMDAFKAGFLHRDFSPGNIIITVDGTGLLIDWDLSKPVSEISETPRCATRTVRANFNILCCDFD
jgi:RIO-like serine/threonine protein kinase